MIVTTAGRPSGIAATAKAIAAINVSRALLPRTANEKPSSLNIIASTSPTTNTNIHIPRTSFVKKDDNSAIFF